MTDTTDQPQPTIPGERPGDIEAKRLLPDGRLLTLQRQLFTWLLTVGPNDSATWDEGWQFESAIRAKLTYGMFEDLTADGGEPPGWVRNMKAGRREHRRRPHADPAKEYLGE